MLELVLLAVIGVGLYRKRGQRWEWSRHRLEQAFRGLSSGSDRVTVRARRAIPALVHQCSRDMRSLGSDFFGLLSPGTQRQLEHRARSLRKQTAERGESLRQRSLSDA